MILEKKSAGCRVCGCDEVQTWLHPLEMMLGMREIFSYFKCASCGCLQLENIPIDIKKYYPTSYYSFQIPNNIKVSWKSLLKRKFVSQSMTNHILGNENIIGKICCSILKNPPLPVWIKYIKSIPFNARILDVGCGSGSNLLMLHACGYRNLYGIDPFIEKSTSYNNGVKVKKSKLDEVEGQFDLIMFHHVFEHLDDPVEHLQKARQLLSKRGQILIRIPLSDSLAAEKYREKWVQLDAPRHITLQTRYSMELMSKKCLLKITKVVYDSFDFQFWGSEQYTNDISLFNERSHMINQKESIFSKEEIDAYAKESYLLNEAEKGDQAAFVFEAI